MFPWQKCLYSPADSIRPLSISKDPLCPMLEADSQINPPSNTDLRCPVIHGQSNQTSTSQNITKSSIEQPLSFTDRSLAEKIRIGLCTNGFASILTTSITALIWQPVITIMVRQQFAAAIASAQQYSGIADAIKKINREGKRIFFRGLTPRLMQSPLAAIQWTTYELFRDVAADRYKSRFDMFKYFLLFFGSRMLVTTAKCPFEIIKERMQVYGSLTAGGHPPLAASGSSTQLTPHSSTWTNVKYLLKTEGFPALFRGLHINLMRDLPIAALMMTGNDLFTHLLLTGSLSGFGSSYFQNDKARRQKGEKTPTHISFLAGALAGCVATVLTQPIDVAKTAIQTQSLARRLGRVADSNEQGFQPYRGFFDVLNRLRKERGIRAWYAGMTTRGFHIVFGAATYLPIYRTVQQQLRNVASKSTNL